MPLPPGTQLGPYTLLSLIGAGAMGEVYKAKDPNLDRLVAIKVLAPNLVRDSDLVARFEREARLVASLSHPNLLGVHDFARDGERCFSVMELLEGESLRDKLRSGALPPKRAVELILPVLEGLAAAHAKGIIHRDIKPENIFITRDGRVKVLDFGLAKQLPAWAGSLGPQSHPPTHPPSGMAPTQATEMGMILGTVGYMAPEQVLGEPADHRTDLFAVGVVLHELLTGEQPFRRSSDLKTMIAIMEEDAPDCSNSRIGVPLALQRIVGRCLEKDPNRRFQCAKDLAYDLVNVVQPAGAGGARDAASLAGKRRNWLAAAAAVLILGLAVMGGRRLRSEPTAAPLVFRRLTFVPGTIESARFGPAGRTVYFSERVGGRAPELFVLDPGAHEARGLGLPDALLLSVSANNELAFLRASGPVSDNFHRGILARVSTGGGAVLDLREDVAEAVWDGAGMATLSLDGAQQFQLEFPTGHKLLAGNFAFNVVGHLSLSPDGTRLAATDADSRAKASIVIFDRDGRKTVLYTKEGDSTGASLNGLAWGPGGEIWVAEVQGDATTLWALTMDRRKRILWQGAGAYQLLDVSREGHVLLAQHQVRYGVLVQAIGEARPREVSVRGGTQAAGLTPDGRNLLLLESPAMLGGTSRDEIYLRPLAGGPALKLGPGNPQTISDDGHWVQVDTGALDLKDIDPAWVEALVAAGLEPRKVADAKARGGYLLFVPNGLGRPFALALPKGCDNPGSAYFLPDGQHLVANSNVNGDYGWVVLDRRGGEPRRLSRPGLGIEFIGTHPISPDSTRMVVTDGGKDWLIQPIAGGEPTPIRGLRPGELVLGWTADGRALFLRSKWDGLPLEISRLDLATGARRPVQNFMPPDPVGHIVSLGVFLTPSGHDLAFTYGKKLSELYLLEGLR